MSPIKFPTKSVFPNFQVLKTNGMMSFCNLFMERLMSACATADAHNNPAYSTSETEVTLDQHLWHNFTLMEARC